MQAKHLVQHWIKMVDIQPEDESISDTDMAELSGPSLKFDASMI